MLRKKRKGISMKERFEKKTNFNLGSEKMQQIIIISWKKIDNDFLPSFFPPSFLLPSFPPSFLPLPNSYAFEMNEWLTLSESETVYEVRSDEIYGNKIHSNWKAKKAHIWWSNIMNWTKCAFFSSPSLPLSLSLSLPHFLIIK